ncbi:phenylacetone monooxygenase [Neofusicoccum parvum]|nr:phenylacetone monooxygenase [Neofusicoccum parvum]
MVTVDPGVAVPDPTIRQKYITERNKRLRPDGTAQFTPLASTPRLSHLATDPWAPHAALNATPPALRHGDTIKFLILGAGFGGLLFAARLIRAGFPAAAIRFVDDAAGFGGTWYWNRYPGLMCDVESYVYMPLLEETGYAPRSKYARGAELREHAERIAEVWGLADKALWRARCRDAVWDEGAGRWAVRVVEGRGPGEAEREVVVSAQYVFAAGGTLNAPQVPRLEGLSAFRGSCFHTSRWDYGVTGGSPEEWELEGLRDKRVGIIGTGATAVQVVPQLAKWAKELYVFQRTPASVDVRGQRPTDPEEWATKIAVGKGWQRARSENFNSYLMGAPKGEDLVNDAWCRMPSYSGIIGAPGNGIVTPDKIPEHLARLHELDLERAERVRARVDEIVKDKETAKKLHFYYPSWCKRPCFHDEYLPAFNQPNVTLVDTDGKGVESLTANGIVANGTEYPVDVLVLSTGYVSPAAGSGSPASRAGMKVIGRNGLSMDDKWAQQGAATLHGVATHDFPNFFFPGPSQAGVTANFTFALDTLASHVAAVLAEAERRVDQPEKMTVEVTKEAEEAWSMEIMMRAGWFATVSGCTPSYINSEGEKDRPTTMEEKMKGARGAPWGEGISSFVDVLKSWQEDGGLKGFEISAA